MHFLPPWWFWFYSFYYDMKILLYGLHCDFKLLLLTHGSVIVSASGFYTSLIKTNGSLVDRWIKML